MECGYFNPWFLPLTPTRLADGLGPRKLPFKACARPTCESRPAPFDSPLLCAPLMRLLLEAHATRLVPPYPSRQPKFENRFRPRIFSSQKRRRAPTTRRRQRVILRSSARASSAHIGPKKISGRGPPTAPTLRPRVLTPRDHFAHRGGERSSFIHHFQQSFNHNFRGQKQEPEARSREPEDAQ
jgi:hypothetical protein